MGYNELLEQMDHSLKALFGKLSHEGYVVITTGKMSEILAEEDVDKLWNLYYDEGVEAVVEELETKYGFEVEMGIF